MQIISHRGNGLGQRENTLAAFEAACEAGVTGIELDVRMTRDRIPVVIHDPNTAIFGGRHRTVARTDRVDLHQELPTLESALDLLTPRLCVDVEIKPISADPTPILRLADRPNTRISSFDWGILRQAKRIVPHLPRCLLAERTVRLPVLLRAASRLEATALHLSYKQLIPQWVDEAHRRRLIVRVYTPNKAAQWQKCADCGVEAIMTDQPLQALDWVHRLGKSSE